MEQSAGAKLPSRSFPLAMKLASFQAITEALQRAGVHFLVVGGVAVNAHGFLRFTRDVDLVVRLSPEDIHAAFRTLETIGYRPAVPITAEQFAEPEKRAEWRREKGMVVLQFWSEVHPETPLDIFVYEPFDFAAEEAIAFRSQEPGLASVGFASIPTLIAMKRGSRPGPQDLLDVEKLGKIHKARAYGEF